MTRCAACRPITSTSIKYIGLTPLCVPIEETADAMQQLYNQGKIRAIGVSNTGPALCVADLNANGHS